MVEVVGGEGSGKSELLFNLTAQCVLPQRWREREVGGRGVEVVWVSTDYKFDVLRMVAVLEGKVRGQEARGEEGEAVSGSGFHQLPALGSQTHTQPGVSSTSDGEDYRSLITSCLSRVHVIYCNSTTELGITLQSLRQSFLPAHPDVCGLVLDNVAEFYWVDRAEAGSVRGSEVRQSVWVGALRGLVEEHHVVVFAARPLLFAQTTTTAPRRGRQASEDRGQGKVYIIIIIMIIIIIIVVSSTRLTLERLL